MKTTSSGGTVPSWLKKPSQLQTFLLSVMTRGHIWHPEEEDEANTSSQTFSTESDSNDVEQKPDTTSENLSFTGLVSDEEDAEDDNRSLSSFVTPKTEVLSDAAEKRRLHLDAVIRAATDSAVWAKLPPARPDKHRKFDTQFKLQAIEYAKEYGNVAASRVYDVDGKSIREWRIREEHLKSIKDLPNGYQRCRLLGGGRRKSDSYAVAAATATTTAATAIKHSGRRSDSFAVPVSSTTKPAVALSSPPSSPQPPPAPTTKSIKNNRRVTSASAALREYKKMNWRKPAGAKMSRAKIIPEPKGPLGRPKVSWKNYSAGESSSFGNYEIISTNSFNVNYDGEPMEGEAERVSVNDDYLCIEDEDDEDITKGRVSSSIGEQKSFWDFSTVKKETA